MLLGLIRFWLVFTFFEN